MKNRLSKIFCAVAIIGLSQFSMAQDDGSFALTKVNLFNGTACDYEHLTPLFFEVWEATTELWEENDSFGDPYWYWPNVWNTACTRVWADPKFPAYAEEVDYVEYWQEVGFPPGFSMTEDGELRYIEP